MSTGPVSVDPTPIDSPSAAVTPAERAASRRPSRRTLRRLLPLAVLALAAAVIGLLWWSRPSPEVIEPVAAHPLVRVEAIAPQSIRMTVTAHGSVAPRTESDLVAEVRGRVLWVAPALVAGGSFDEGEELLRLDDREYVIAVERARAQVKLRQSEARLAAAEAERRRQLASRGAASSAELEEMESRALVAEASLDESRALLRQAELDLERTVVRAPFDGRVRERPVDVGQFVNPGVKLARVYAVDFAEVRLPVATDDLAHLELGSAREGGAGSPITLRARLGGAELEWPATLVRTEGEIDLETRTMHLVARVEDPYGRTAERPAPLPSGLFVEAEIEGRELRDVYVLPSSAVRDGERVFLADADDRLVIRPIEVLRREADRVVVREGLGPGDRLIVSPLRVVSPGMQLRIAEDEAS